MGIISNAMLIVSGGYLALGLIYLCFWVSQRSRKDYLAFTFCTLSTTLYAWFELGMIKSQTPDVYLFYAWWDFLVAVSVTISVAWFAYVNLNGRRWLFWAYCAFRLLGLVLHLFLPNGINFREITSVAKVNVLGEALSYATFVPNEWMILAHLSHLLLVIFCLDASIRTWRHGKRRTALVFGTGVVLSRTIGSIVAIGVLWGLMPLPFFTSFSIIFVVAAMLYELNNDMHRAAMAETQAAKLGGRLTEIVANVPGVVWESRTEPGTNRRKTTFISQYVQRMLGYSPDEWLKQPPGFGARIIPEEERERVLRESDEVIETGKQTVSQFRWITKDGQIRWVENHLAPIVDEQAGIVGLRGVALDVTERHTAQQALRESESFNRTILSSLNTHVCVLDRDGRIISVNHAWAAFALENGSASEASVGPGVSYLDVCRKATEGAALAQVALDGVKAVCDGTKEYFQLEYPCHSPTEKRWFLMSVTPLKSDRGGAVVVHNDITDRELAAEAARESKARLAETLDQLQLSAAAANVGLWTRKVGEGVVWLSEKAVDVWGFPSGTQVSAEDVFQRIHPADRESYLTNIREVEEWKNDYQIEYRFLSPDGSVRWIHGRGKVEVIDGFRIIRGAIVDITKLKMAEEAVRELSHKLLNAQEQERARLARELHDDLSQSISLLSVQLTILRNEPRDLEYVRDHLEQYISDVERLSGDVRRISHELHPAILGQLGLEATLNNFCRDLAAAHSLRIDFEAEDLPSDLPFEISSCLYRVTQESLQNVIKHSGATSAKVSIRSKDREIRLSVSDDGNGFDTEAAKKKDALGLISIDERVRAVKGTAKVNSAVGEGTKIDVHIPVDQESNGLAQN